MIRTAIAALVAVLVTIGGGWVLGFRLPSAADQAFKSLMVLAVGVVMGAVIALGITYRRRQPRNRHREQVKRYRERFAVAGEMFGSDKAYIRAMGAHALGYLADDWISERQTCVDVLCDYIRMPYEPPAELDSDASPDAVHRNETRKQEQRLRKAIMDIIGDRLRAYPYPGNRTWHDCAFDFSGATIDYCDFSTAKLRGARIDFSNARLVGYRLSFFNAEFYYGDVDFTGVRFTNGVVDFDNVRFHGGSVNFAGAELADGYITFTGARLVGGIVDFEKAEFAGATVDFGRVADWSCPPRLPDLPELPRGLRIPVADGDDYVLYDPDEIPF